MPDFNYNQPGIINYVSFQMGDDRYKTIEGPSEGLYREKGSRFLSFSFPVSGVEDIKPILDTLRKQYHDARHHCYAYMLGQERLTWRVNDDGEPSGTGGKPILGQINSYGLTNILIVVVRYFGGTLLGVSGLINAYRSAAASALENARITERMLQEHYFLTFPYIAMNDVMKVLKEENIAQYDQVFDTECRLNISFRASAREKVIARLSRIDGLTYDYLETS
jgi:uncharacterized YigZ family protein